MQSPSECHSVFAIGVTTRENPSVSPQHAASAALKQQNTLWRVVIWWDKFCTHFLGTKALKLRHSHITSPLTRFTVCVSLETQLKILLSFFWDPHWSGQCRTRQGAVLGMLGEHRSCTKQTRTALHSHDKGNLRGVKSSIILLSHTSGYYRSLHNIPRFNTETVLRHFLWPLLLPESEDLMQFDMSAPKTFPTCFHQDAKRKT